MHVIKLNHALEVHILLEVPHRVQLVILVLIVWVMVLKLAYHVLVGARVYWHQSILFNAVPDITPLVMLLLVRLALRGHIPLPQVQLVVKVVP